MDAPGGSATGRHFGLNRAAREVAEARHLQAIWLLTQGRTTLEVADVLAFTSRWVEELAVRYSAHGPEALGNLRRSNGRATGVLTEAALAERLARRPQIAGAGPGADRFLDSGPSRYTARAPAASAPTGAPICPPLWRANYMRMLCR